MTRFFRILLSMTAAIFVAAVCLYSQDGRSHVSGAVLEENGDEPVIQAVVELLNAKDSTRVLATVTDLEGKFRIPARVGQYLLKISMMGYVTQVRSVRVVQSQQENDVGTVRMEVDTYWIEAAKVVSKVEPVTIIEDTVVYNAAAYNVADDASISELLEKIPGLEINGNSISLYGKNISQLLVNGKRFSGGEVMNALKNLPANMIENIKAYERESDQARISGVDDGEEVSVLDLTVKKSFFDNWNTTTTAGAGTSGRYAGKFNANKITDKSHITAIANIGNENYSGLSGNTSRNVLGSGGSGEVTNGNAGMTFAKESDTLKTSANVRYTYSDSDAIGQRHSQTLLKDNNSFSDADSRNMNERHNVNANYNLEFRASDKITIMFKPTLNWSSTNTTNNTLSLTASDEEMLSKINSNTNYNTTNERSGNGSAEFQITRRFEKRGRSLSFYNYNYYGATSNERFQDQRTRYYRIKSNPDSTLIRQYDNDTRNTNFNTYAQLSWNEPITDRFSFQAIARFRYKLNTNERNAISHQDASLDEHVNGRYNYYSGEFYASLRYTKKGYFVSAGATALPQRTVLSSGETEVTNHAFNASPFITVRITKSKTQKLNFTYRGNANQPSMYDLLPVTNGTNPLNVHIGNPDLKPAYNHNMNLSYNSSNVKKQNSLVCNASSRMVRNAVSNSTTYDETTGGRTITPKNINGNWNVSGSVVWNKTFSDNRFSVSTNTRGEHSTSKSFLWNKTIKEDEINTSNRLMGVERVEMCYRVNWFEVVLNMTGTYTAERNLLKPALNQNPYSFAGGLAPVVNFPWKTRISSSFDVWCQRGYAYSEYNKNYMLWNATISQSLFKGKATARLSFYDILNQQTNMTRTFTAERRTTTTFNGVHRYALLRLVWRFNQNKK